VIAGGETVNALTGNPYSVASQALVSYLYGHYATGRPTLRFFTTNNLAVRRDLFREVGGFDPQFRQAAAEDREFCVRCARHDIELVHVRDAVVYHAHALTWRTFWRQHFTYGREAYRFHALQERADGRPFEVEPLSFYTRMLAYPFRHGERRALAVTGLLGMSQLANTSGFLREAARSRAQSRAARRETTRA
jgi:GT2 family glycosyltransferase